MAHDRKEVALDTLARLGPLFGSDKFPVDLPAFVPCAGFDATHAIELDAGHVTRDIGDRCERGKSRKDPAGFLDLAAELPRKPGL